MKPHKKKKFFMNQFGKDVIKDVKMKKKIQVQ